MKFNIYCSAIKEFDAEKNAYVRCQHEIQVDSAQIGSLIKCPQCGNDVEVTNPNVMSSLPEATDSNNNLPTNDDDILGEKVATGDQGTMELAQDLDAASLHESGVVDLVTEIPGTFEATDPLMPAPIVDPAQGAHSAQPDSELRKESPNAVKTPVLTQTSFGRTNSCHKCGTLLEEKQAVCPNCKADRRAAYVDKGDRKVYSKAGPFGFQLYLASITNSKRLEQDENSLFTAVCYVVSVLLFGAGIAFVVFAGVPGFFIGLPTAFVGFSLFTGLWYWGKTKKDPRAKMPLLGEVYWAVVLFFVRKIKIARFPEGKVLDKNGDEDFGDADLIQMKDLAKYKAVDLDGTSVSDEGLLYLYNVRGIQFLIVRNTNVTPDGAHDLQQTIPKTWIWF